MISLIGGLLATSGVTIGAVWAGVGRLVVRAASRDESAQFVGTGDRHQYDRPSCNLGNVNTPRLL